MKLLFIVVGDRGNSNSRERVWAYLPRLRERGYEPAVHITGEVAPGWRGRAGYLRRLHAQASEARAVFVHRVPLGLSERLVLGAAGTPVIFDLDDAIWYAIDPEADGAPRPGRRLAPLHATLRMASLVRAGSPEIERTARTLNPRVSLAPTCTEMPEPSPEPDGPLTIGWIGHSGNFRYFDVCATALDGMRVRVVADVPPPIPAEFKPWALEEEAADVRSFHIGIMPLADTPWARAKCGFKLLLYMAHGRPVVASPVGVNAELVTPDRGFLARTPEEWREALRALAGDAPLRRRMGAAGRAFVESHYSRERGLRDLLRDIEAVSRG